MPRTFNVLTTRSIAGLSKPGRYRDTDHLYLFVDRDGNKRWSFLYRRDKRLREMGLGSFRSVSLAMARDLAKEARELLAQGIDPIVHKKASRSKSPTFSEIADVLIKRKEAELRNPKHIAQWRSTLAQYAKPIANKPVNEITTDDVVDLLKPIWSKIPETASRVRGRVEAVFSLSKVLGHRKGENPATWRGHLDQIFPSPKKSAKDRHFPCLHYKDLPDFMIQLQGIGTVTSLALEFTILTAARSGEIRNFRWRSYDAEKKLWSLAADETKQDREHDVPLTPRAIEILEIMRRNFPHGPNDLVFPGAKPKTPLSDMTMTKLVRGLSEDRITVHGFRSTFRDYIGDETGFVRELAEAALGHIVGDKVEQAYRRSTAIEKRRPMMDAWEDYALSKVRKAAGVFD